MSRPNKTEEMLRNQALESQLATQAAQQCLLEAVERHSWPHIVKAAMYMGEAHNCTRSMVDLTGAAV